MLTARTPWFAGGNQRAPTTAAALLNIDPGAKVIVLTNAHRAGAIRKQIPNATVVTDVAFLDGLEPGFDAAVIDGLLQDEPWDRWVLQRVHRLLRMDARIVVVVPPLTSLLSALDLGFLR